MLANGVRMLSRITEETSEGLFLEIPQEILDHLNLSLGSEVEITPITNGLSVTPVFKNSP